MSCDGPGCELAHIHDHFPMPRPQPDRLKQGADAIRARIKELDQYKATYLAYLHDRITDADWHACWDVCVNLSEVSCERDGLTRALDALGMEL